MKTKFLLTIFAVGASLMLSAAPEAKSAAPAAPAISAAKADAAAAPAAAADQAAKKPAKKPGFFDSGMLPIIIMVVVMIFFFSRSNKKQQQKRQEMLDRIVRGTRVMLNSGVYGKVVEVREKEFIVEIAENVRIEVIKNGVASVEDENNAAADKAKENK